MKLPINLNLLKKRSIILLVIVLIVTSSIFVVFRLRKGGDVESVTVRRGDIESTVSTSGTLNGKDSVSLKFNTSGKLISVNVAKGDSVYKGQVLASLDSQKQSTDLQQAQNNLRDKQASLEKILDDIHLYQYGNGGFANVSSSSETQTQRQARTSAEVAKDNAFDSVKLSQRAFQDLVLISPVNGVVIQPNFLPGQFVSPADVILQVIDNSQTFFDAEVDESDISKVSQNQEVEVSLNSFPNQTFKGIVTKILPTTKTSSSGATVVIVRIKLEDFKGFIYGISGQAEIIIEKVKNVLIIPAEALKDENSVVMKKGRVPKEVKVGVRSDTEVEIIEGLEEGQEILRNP